jgi:stearoyl-CoA desaturase (delta-9 desaturase)
VNLFSAIIITSWIILGLIDVDLLLWMLVLPTVLALHLEGMVNLFCHTTYGYRNFDTKDNSRNVYLLGIFDWGNGWHNNHHYNQSSYDFGTNISKKWYEFDPCRIFIPILKF